MNKYNKYDYGVALLIALLTFGGIGGSFQPIRMIALISTPFVLLKIASLKIERRDGYLLMLFIIWYAYALASIMWTPAPEEGLKQLVYFLVHFSMFFQLVFLARKSNNVSQSIAVGWLLAAGVSLPIAIYEVATSNHLAISRFDSDAVINTSSGVLQLRYADTTFGDLNAYSIFLCYAAFFLFSGLLIDLSKKIKIMITVELLTIAYVLFVNSSRGAIISFSIITFFFFVFYVKRSNSKESRQKKWNIYFAFIAPLLLILFIANFLDIDSYRILHRFSSGFDASEDSRLNIYGSAFRAMLDSYFVGTGVGSEIVVLENYYAAVPNSHNLLIEILLQYGFFICLGFLFFIGKIIKNLFLKKYYLYRFLSVSFAVAFVPIFVVISGYLLSPAFWVFIGSMYVLSTNNNFLKNPAIKLTHEICPPHFRPRPF